MNYTQLKAAVQAYAENFGDNFTENIDTFIRLAEQRIYNTAQLPATRSSTTLSTTASNRYLTVPADFLAVNELAVIRPNGDYVYVLSKDVSFIREAYANPNATGVPAYYAVFNDNQLLLGPTPDQIYQAELNYFAYPTSIVTAGTTWLGDNFESVLLHGALVEAAIFDKAEEDMMAYYKEQFDKSMSLLKQLAEGRNTQDDYRSGHIRFGVR